MADRVSPKIRQWIAETARFRCEYCLSPAAFSPSPFNIEHIEPSSLGGKTEMENLAYACNGCNGFKHNKTSAEDPLTETRSPLFHPRRDRWPEHFLWSESSLSIIGISPSGRATVELLKLNRVELLNLRQLLVLVGKHPPMD